mmetsp:Transcript_25123/g.81073  ORF Transcript_25123/g.81073 Transcript_25123/m.81073 type:complete len:230 (+) Transcript_25123:682-1371(+)
MRMRSAPARMACVVHLASLLLLFFISSPSTAVRCWSMRDRHSLVLASLLSHSFTAYVLNSVSLPPLLRTPCSSQRTTRSSPPSMWNVRYRYATAAGCTPSSAYSSSKKGLGLGNVLRRASLSLSSTCWLRFWFTIVASYRRLSSELIDSGSSFVGGIGDVSCTVSRSNSLVESRLSMNRWSPTRRNTRSQGSTDRGEAIRCASNTSVTNTRPRPSRARPSITGSFEVVS